MSLSIPVRIIIGFIVLTFVVRVLKLEVKQKRPTDANGKSRCKQYNPNHGWPSGHTALAAYFATVAVIWCLQNCTTRVTAICGVVVIMLCIAVVLAMAKSRVIQGCHTWNQTKYGAMFGTVIGVLTMMM